MKEFVELTFVKGGRLAVKPANIAYIFEPSGDGSFYKEGIRCAIVFVGDAADVLPVGVRESYEECLRILSGD